MTNSPSIAHTSAVPPISLSRVFSAQIGLPRPGIVSLEGECGSVLKQCCLSLLPTDQVRIQLSNVERPKDPPIQIEGCLNGVTDFGIHLQLRSSAVDLDKLRRGMFLLERIERDGLSVQKNKDSHAIYNPMVTVWENKPEIRVADAWECLDSHPGENLAVKFSQEGQPYEIVGRLLPRRTLKNSYIFENKGKQSTLPRSSTFQINSIEVVSLDHPWIRSPGAIVSTEQSIELRERFTEGECIRITPEYGGHVLEGEFVSVDDRYAPLIVVRLPSDKPIPPLEAVYSALPIKDVASIESRQRGGAIRSLWRKF